MKADINTSITNTHLLKKLLTRVSEGLNSSLIFSKCTFFCLLHHHCNWEQHFAHMDETIISE